LNLLHPYWARQRIGTLDAEKDFKEINHLAFEVRYASPIFTHTLFSIAFARQAAVPSIARLLYRDGRGASITAAHKRSNDTLLFFGEFFLHGDSEKGQQVAEQLNRIHSRFPITNEENLYTLATLMCEPIRMSYFLTGRNIFRKNETRALYLFWRMVAGMLHIHSIPDDENKMFDFYEQYAHEHFAYTHDGRQVVEALADEFAQRWYPHWMKWWGRQVYFSLFDDHLRETFRLPVSPLFFRLSVRGYLWFFLRVWSQVTPDPSDRSIIKMFSRDYKDYDISKAGPDASNEDHQ
jgi:hypothetical protein